MECSLCGGYVEWKGPLVNLTHTECHGCGAINSQVVEDDTPDDDPCEYCGNGDRVPQEAWICPKCDAEWPAYESPENNAITQPHEN